MSLTRDDASALLTAAQAYAIDQERKGFYSSAIIYYQLAQRLARTACQPIEFSTDIQYCQEQVR